MSSPSPEVWLATKFESYDWYHSVGRDEFKKLVLYVNYMNSEMLNLTSSLDRDIKIHFAGSITATKDIYTDNQSAINKLEMHESDLSEDIDLSEFDGGAISVVELSSELERLEKICGSNILQDIFYEVHDGKNAITNLSFKFPDVKHAVDLLYAKYGFDNIYEELDG